MTGPAAGVVKCVVWDIDHTLLSGVYLESAAQLPPADPAMAAALRELAGRGIVHAIASRNPPAAAEHVAQATGHEFAAAECGWGRKSDAVARIAAELNIATGALAFVDDDPYERAEVSFALPPVLVLSPQDMADAVGWPEFSPSVVTAEARRRGAMYAQRRSRLAAERSFGGSREEFLRFCGTRVTIAEAAAADVPRLHELSERTSQFNSAGEGLAEDVFRSLMSGQAGGVLTVRLRDTFGDDGLVGGCVTESDGGIWMVRLLMMSCRAMGRGVIEALLTWLTRSAAQAGAQALHIPCTLNDRNVPLRLALTAAGFRSADGQAAEAAGPRGAVFRLEIAGQPPELPGWVESTVVESTVVESTVIENTLINNTVTNNTVEAATAVIAEEIRRILATATGRTEMLDIPMDMALFGRAVALGSLTGTLLLRQIRERFGVDVAADDLNLDALATLGTLAEFVAERTADRTGEAG